MYIPSSAYAVESTTPKGRAGNGDGSAAALREVTSETNDETTSTRRLRVV